jgi:hypothetical protein
MTAKGRICLKKCSNVKVVVRMIRTCACNENRAWGY